VAKGTRKKLHSGAKTYNNKKTLEIDRNLPKKDLKETSK
jgi:hypothetical protein